MSSFISFFAEIAKFFIAWCFDDQEGFNLDVPVGSVLRGRELRAAIAEARGVDMEQLEMQQWRAKKKFWFLRRAIVEVVGDPRYADEQGRAVSCEELDSEENHVILDDETVITAGHLRAWISVFRRQ